MITIGIDNGNFNTKSSDGTLYHSGFSASAQPPIGDADYIELDGVYYALGSVRAPVQYDKTRNNDAWILTLAMLAAALRLRNMKEGSFRIGVGLPLMAYAAQRENMREYFLRRGGARCGYCGAQYEIRIADCGVYPQGYAAFLTQYSDLAPYASVTHVDIGGYTIDIFRTQDGKPVPGSMISVPLGTVTMLRTIKTELSRSDILLTETQIITATSGGIVDHMRIEEAMRAIDMGRDRYVQDLCNTLREYQIDLESPINLIGGGAALLEHALRERMHVVGVADLFANALGYKLWMERDAK